MQKFENVDVLAALGEIMRQNTAFYRNDFDIDKTAVALFQHPNTIRYRINKLKELMSVNSDLEFQVLASLYHNLPL